MEKFWETTYYTPIMYFLHMNMYGVLCLNDTDIYFAQLLWSAETALQGCALSGKLREDRQIYRMFQQEFYNFERVQKFIQTCTVFWNVII
jgi:hypothetical protein